jgi:ligand-binding sensor domain-containing protein
MRRRILFTFILSILCFFSFSQSYPFKNFNSTNGLTAATVYKCFQDSKGYMWFGTETGAVRFDGKNFRQYTIDDGLSDNEIFSISEDSQKRIWFLPFSGRPSFLKNDTFYNPLNNAVLQKIKSDGSLSMFMEDEHGKIWIGSLGTDLFTLTGNDVKHYDLKDSKLAVSFVKNNHEIWICTETGFFRIHNNKIERILTRYIPHTYRMATNDENGNIIFLSEEGLIKMSGLKEEVIIPKKQLKIPLKLMGGIYIDKNENLWIPTLGEGIHLYKKNGNTYVFEEVFLEGKIITDVTCDHEGNYWFCTVGNGVYMLPFNYKNYSSYTITEGLTNNYVYSICKDNEGRIWLGMNRGLVHVIDKKNIKTYDINFLRIAYLRVLDIVRDQENNIWVATDRSLVKFKSPYDPLQVVRPVDSPRRVFPKNIDVSSSGDISLTTAKGVMKAFVKDNEYHFAIPENFEVKRTFTHHYDAKGRLWVATIEGLNCYENNHLIKYGETNELLKKRITDIQELNDSILVLSTYGYGVIFFKSGKVFRHLTASMGLSSNICKKMFIDADKNIWVATNNGVSKINYGNGNIVIEKFTTYDGLLSDDVNDIYVDSLSVCIATTGGLSIIKEFREKNQGSVPPVLINRVVSGTTDITKKPGIYLAYNNNRILIDFIALSYSDPLELIYQYRLNNNHASWETTRNTTVEFSSLAPGEYHFELRAKKEGGSWSNPVVFDFTITPPLWMNMYFVVPLILIIGAIIVFIIRYNIIKTREKHTERLRIQNKMIQLEQKALQAMMNPHFIFNVMNSIQNYLSSHDQFSANQYLSSFAKLIRKNMDIATESFISLDDEITYLNLYLSLEKVRFEDRLIYMIEKDQELDMEDVVIPTMLIQPFIENAIWHGIMPSEKQGNIHIKFMYVNDELHIEIKDNGVGIDNSISNKPEKKDHTSRGIGLVLERIQLINQTSEHSIQVKIHQNESESGTTVMIFMPINMLTVRL